MIVSGTGTVTAKGLQEGDQILDLNPQSMASPDVTNILFQPICKDNA
jgi:type II secretory pathway component PulC